MALSMPAILIFALSKSWAVVRLEEEIGKRACFSISRRVELVGIHLAIRWSRLQMITDQVTKMMPIGRLQSASKQSARRHRYSLVSKVSSMDTFLPVWNGHFASFELQLVTVMWFSFPNFASDGHGVNSAQLTSATKLRQATAKASTFSEDILGSVAVWRLARS